jgi:hypothetical protein
LLDEFAEFVRGLDGLKVVRSSGICIVNMASPDFIDKLIGSCLGASHITSNGFDSPNHEAGASQNCQENESSNYAENDD